jgi:hypothetical protein
LKSVSCKYGETSSAVGAIAFDVRLLRTVNAVELLQAADDDVKSPEYKKYVILASKLLQ